MIASDNGTKVFFDGEWNASKRTTAIYHARKLGGGEPTTKVIEGALIVWPGNIDAAQRLDDMRSFGRMALGIDAIP